MPRELSWLMPRKSRPRWPALPKRQYGSGSLSREATTGEIRARLPRRISPTRKSRLFGPADADAAGAWLDAQLQPDNVVAASLTLGEWAGEWYATYVAPIHPPNTARWYLYALKKLNTLYTMPLADVRTAQLQAVVGQLAQTIDPATIKGVVAVWRRCLEAAFDDDLIAKNRAKQVRLPSLARPAQTERRHITADEVALLWPAIRDHRFEAAYALMLGCGLRIGEIMGLHWEHVELDAGRAWIQHQFTNHHWRPLPKGSNPHWVRLPPAVVTALRRHRAGQPESATLVMQSPHPPRSKRDRKNAPARPWAVVVVRADLATLLKTADIAPAAPHASRHGLASFWLDGGVPAAVVAERLGHANAGVTLKFYARPSSEGHARADELADELLSVEPPDGVSEGDTGTLSTTLGVAAS